MSRNKAGRLLSLVLLTALLTACSQGSKEEVSLVTFATSGVSNDKTTEVVNGDLNKEYSMSGYVTYNEGMMVSLKADNVEYVETLVVAGEEVKTGDPLVVFRQKTDNVRLTEIDLQLKELDDQLSDGLAQRARAVEELEKQRQEIDNISEADLIYRDQINREIINRQLARAALEQEQFEMQIAEQKRLLTEERAELKENEEDLIVVSPMDGVVQNLQYITPGVTCWKNQMLLMVIDPNKYYLLSENGTSGAFRLGQSVRISYGRNDERKETTGTVIYSDSALPTSLARGGAAIRVDDAELSGKELLNPTITADAMSLKQVLLLPRDAIYKESGNSYVLLKDGSAIRKRFILTGPTNNEQVMVLYGLTQGQTAVIQ